MKKRTDFFKVFLMMLVVTLFLFTVSCSRDCPSSSGGGSNNNNNEQATIYVYFFSGSTHIKATGRVELVEDGTNKILDWKDATNEESVTFIERPEGTIRAFARASFTNKTTPVFEYHKGLICSQSINL